MTIVHAAASLIPQLSFAITGILGQFGELVRGVPIEDLVLLLVRITTLIWPLRVLAASSVSLRDVVLPELTDVVIWPLLDCRSILGGRFFDTV